MPGLGHLGFGFAAKSATPRVPLWVLLICSEILDIISIILIIINVEDIWQSHSLIMAVVYSVGAMTVAGAISKDLRVSSIIGLVVFSHWIWDAIAWPMTFIFPYSETRLPIFFDESLVVGLGVSSTLIGVLIMEMGPNIAGGIIYYRYIKNSKK